jgi:hypothetical protein
MVQKLRRFQNLNLDLVVVYIRKNLAMSKIEERGCGSVHGTNPFLLFSIMEFTY